MTSKEWSQEAHLGRQDTSEKVVSYCCLSHWQIHSHWVQQGWVGDPRGTPGFPVTEFESPLQEEDFLSSARSCNWKPWGGLTRNHLYVKQNVSSFSYGLLNCDYKQEVNRMIQIMAIDTRDFSIFLYSLFLVGHLFSGCHSCTTITLSNTRHRSHVAPTEFSKGMLQRIHGKVHVQMWLGWGAVMGGPQPYGTCLGILVLLAAFQETELSFQDAWAGSE